MTKFGQAEYNDYVAKAFVAKLGKIIEEIEKQQYNNRNTEDMYIHFPSSRDAA